MRGRLLDVFQFCGKPAVKLNLWNPVLLEVNRYYSWGTKPFCATSNNPSINAPSITSPLTTISNAWSKG